ncbi:MAG: hypothetical protein JNK53_03390 [Phycisphaerae bacterium]|nr:hypothetical protein [Phycisphaerae bacterium]
MTHVGIAITFGGRFPIREMPWYVGAQVAELYEMLEEAFLAAPEGAEFIFPTLRKHPSPGMPVLRAAAPPGTGEATSMLTLSQGVDR